MKYHENEVWCCKLEQLFLNFWKISRNVTIEKNFKNIFSIFGWFPCSNPDQISSKISKSHFFFMNLMNEYYWENHQKKRKKKNVTLLEKPSKNWWKISESRKFFLWFHQSVLLGKSSKTQKIKNVSLL